MSKRCQATIDEVLPYIVLTDFTRADEMRYLGDPSIWNDGAESMTTPYTYVQRGFMLSKAIGGSALTVARNRIGIVNIPAAPDTAIVFMPVRPRRRETAIVTVDSPSEGTDTFAYYAAATAVYNLANGVRDPEAEARVARISDELEEVRLAASARLDARAALS